MQYLKTIFFVLLTLSHMLLVSSSHANNITEPPEEMPEITPIVVEETSLLIVLEIPSDVVLEDKESLLPYLGYSLDNSNKSPISVIGNIELLNFIPYNALNFRNEQGLIWLKMHVEPFQLEEALLPIINLGENIQGNSYAWVKRKDATRPTYAEKISKHVYRIDNLALEGGEVYIAIEGIPSLWFAPQLVFASSEGASRGITPIIDKGTPYNFILFTMLACLTALCFLRFLLEKGGWRFWASMFGLSGLLINYCGIPATPEGQVISSDLIPLFALAAAFFTYGAIGRSIMFLVYSSKKVNFYFHCVAILGIFLALLPLIPDFAWIVRYFESWQLVLALYLLPTMYLYIRGGRGRGLFLLITCILVATAAIPLINLKGDLVAQYWALAPYAGLTFSMLLLLLSPSYYYSKAINKEDEEYYAEQSLRIVDSKLEIDVDNAISENEELGAVTPIIKEEKEETSDSLLSLSLEKEEEPKEEVKKASIRAKNIQSEKIEDPADIWYDNTESFENAQTFARIEQALRIPLDSLMREICFLEQQLEFIRGAENQVFKDKANVHAQALLSTGKDISTLAGSLPKLVLTKPPKRLVKISFNLQNVLRQVYEKVRYEAASSQIALSWFRSPVIGLWYVGEKDSLATLLYQLLSDAIRATKQGIVYMRVERDENSNDYGRLAFTIGDSGMGTPPERRASSLLSRVWELTASHNGEFTVESTPNGTEYRFILSLKALEDDGVTEKPIPNFSSEDNPTKDKALLLIAANESFERHMLSFRLERMPCRVLETMDLDECLKQYKNTPSGIIVLGAELNEASVQEFIVNLRAFEKEHELEQAQIIALAKDSRHEVELTSAGCNYILESTARRISFRTLVEKLLRENAVISQDRISLMQGESDNEKAYLAEKSGFIIDNVEVAEFASPIAESDDKKPTSEKKPRTRRRSSAKEKKGASNIPAIKLNVDVEESDKEKTNAKKINVKTTESKKGDTFYVNNDQVVDLPSFKTFEDENKENNEEENSKDDVVSKLKQ